jgi:hypothetical protein
MPQLMQFCNIYWRHKAVMYSADVRIPVSVSLLHLRPWCVGGFFYFIFWRFISCTKEDFGALIFISIYSGLKCCPSPLDATGNRVLLRNFRNTSLFTDTWRNSPSVSCVSAANHVCKDVDVMRKTMLILKTISTIGCDISISNYLRFFWV